MPELRVVSAEGGESEDGGETVGVEGADLVDLIEGTDEVVVVGDDATVDYVVVCVGTTGGGAAMGSGNGISQ